MMLIFIGAAVFGAVVAAVLVLPDVIDVLSHTVVSKCIDVTIQMMLLLL